MRLFKRTYLLCILFIFAHTFVWATDVTNVRIGNKKTFTRIVFDLNEKPSIYNIKYLGSPDRIIIDFTDGNILKNALKNTSGYSLINKISGTNIRDSGFNIEIELQQSANFKHFVLEPSTNVGYRLVVDVTPGIHNFPSKPQTIIPDKNISNNSQSKDNVTNYKSDTIELYNNKILSDATIEQLFNPIQGNTQLRRSYYLSDFEFNEDKKKFTKEIFLEKKSSAPTFDIRGYKIKGNTLLSVDTLKDSIKQFTGMKKTFSDVQHALESLENSYQKAGFGMVQVYLPEQELNKGIIVFNVIEPKIDTLTVQGANHFNLANIQKSIVSIKKEQTPNTKIIAKNLLLINENPAKKTTVQFLASEEEGKLNAIINVNDKDPSSYSLSLDNTGTESTGEYRIGLSYQHANITNQDDVLNFQYTTSEKTQALSAYSLGYHLPLYQLNSSFDAFAGYSKIDSGVIQDLYRVSGKGIVFGMRLNQLLNKHNNYSHRLTYGFDYKSYDVDAVQLSGGGSIIPDIKVKPLSLTYSGQWASSAKATGFNLQVHYNAFATSKDNIEFNNSRTGAKPNYLIFRYGIEHARTFSKTWQLRVALTGQQTSDALISGEQFGAGGATSVRGYNERDITNDKGLQITTEIYTPNYAHVFNLNGDMRGLIFYDMGQVSRNLAQPGETTSSEISSYGLGFRLNRNNNLTFKLDFALPLKSTTTQKSGETKIHTALKYDF